MQRTAPNGEQLARRERFSDSSVDIEPFVWPDSLTRRERDVLALLLDGRRVAVDRAHALFERAHRPQSPEGDLPQNRRPLPDRAARQAAPDRLNRRATGVASIHPQRHPRAVGVATGSVTPRARSGATRHTASGADRLFASGQGRGLRVVRKNSAAPLATHRCAASGPALERICAQNESSLCQELVMTRFRTRDSEPPPSGAAA